ncbi:MAG TPA: hypothetical protein VHF27_03485 [Acidimicrobiales bacterium]|nr:hypothetical protein [Acidimicrobiales bacterium]
MIPYLLLGLLGLAVTLVGTSAEVYWLIPVGMAVIFASFFWFVRGRQGTPIMTKEDGAQR